MSLFNIYEKEWISMRVRIDADACPVTRLALALCRERGVAVTLY